MGRKGGKRGGQNHGYSKPNPYLNQDVSINVTHSSMDSIPLREDHCTKSVVAINLSSFKTKKCPNKEEHNHKQCPFFHTVLDRKRIGGDYSSDLCPKVKDTALVAQGKHYCDRGDFCDKSHNRVEQLYREDAYKTKFCNKYPDRIHECEYGDYCSFAHDESEIKIQLIHNYVFDADFYMFHYKTIFCPFNLTQHDKALCVYAHNWQDYRRKPDVIYYEPEPCEFWNPDGFIEDYNSACPAKEKCTKCHGWKELEFHPLVYKVNPCKNPDNCPKGSLCPLYHNEEERRFIDPKVRQGIFRYNPRNRIIKHTFKYNRGSDLRKSFSKSLSRDFNESTGSNEIKTKSAKGGHRVEDNLLIKSLKNNYKNNPLYEKPQPRRRHVNQTYNYQDDSQGYAEYNDYQSYHRPLPKPLGRFFQGQHFGPQDPSTQQYTPRQIPGRAPAPEPPSPGVPLEKRSRSFNLQDSPRQTNNAPVPEDSLGYSQLPDSLDQLDPSRDPAFEQQSWQEPSPCFSLNMRPALNQSHKFDDKYNQFVPRFSSKELRGSQKASKQPGSASGSKKEPDSLFSADNLKDFVNDFKADN